MGLRGAREGCPPSSAWPLSWAHVCDGWCGCSIILAMWPPRAASSTAGVPGWRLCLAGGCACTEVGAALSLRMLVAEPLGEVVVCDFCPKWIRVRVRIP